MADKIIGAGDFVQLLISQKGVQALITLMVIATVLGMMAVGREVPRELMLLASGLVGLYFEIPTKSGGV